MVKILRSFGNAYQGKERLKQLKMTYLRLSKRGALGVTSFFQFLMGEKLRRQFESKRL